MPALDKKCFSQMALMAMITNPEDGKSNNYFVVDRTDFHGETFSHIVAIDNDHYFVPPFVKSLLPDWLAKPTPFVKCILFCMDEMFDYIDKEVVEDFLALQISQVIPEWLTDIRNMDASYKKFNVEVIDADNDTGCQTWIPMMFHSTAIQDLYGKLYRLRDILTKEKQITHLELFHLMESELAKIYEVELSKSTTPTQRFKALFADQFKGGKV